MASLATDNLAERSAAKPPIAAHPAFPAIVALWFAALLGLGSLIVPLTLLETAVVATGLADAVPAAAPPLGMTARALVALVCTLLGGVSGMLIARQIAKQHRRGPVGKRARNAGTNGRGGPINAHDELGAEGLGETAPRRRSLTVEVDQTPSDFLELAPMPGVRCQEDGHDLAAQDGETLDLDALAEGEADAPDTELPNEELPDAELEDEAMTEMPEFFAPGTLVQGEHEQAFLSPAEDDIAQWADDDSPETPQFLAPDAEAAPAHTANTAAIEEVEPEGVGNPLPFSAAAYEYPSGSEFAAEPREPAAAESNAEKAVEDTVVEDTVEDMVDAFAEPAPAIADTPQTDSEDPADWRVAPLGNLGLVQLAQRLGASIEKRRESRHAKAALTASVAMPTFAADEGDQAAQAEETAQATASYFAADAKDESREYISEDATAAPFTNFGNMEALAEGDLAEEGLDTADAPDSGPEIAPEQDHQTYQPLSGFAKLGGEENNEEEEDGEDEIADLAASFRLPLAQSASSPAEETWTGVDEVEEVQPFQSFDAPRHALESAPQPQQDDLDDDDTSFGSLLNLQNPFKSNAEEFVRIEDEDDLDRDGAEPAVVFPSEEKAKNPARADDSARSFDRPGEEAAPPAGQAAPTLDAEENERALREALLNLQRMSGAA